MSDALDSIEAVLDSCALVKFPRKLTEDGLPSREKVALLESHMLDCAVARSDAEEARLLAHKAYRKLREDWNGIEGWETAIRGAASKATGPQIDAAKAKMRPDLAPALQHSEWLVKRLSEQISRFKQDEDTTSRLYTIATGS